MQPLNDLVGTVLEERYRIEQQLGAGAMGAVYRGRHIKVGRTVAIKVLHDHLVRDDTMVERFEREAKIAARLKHRNLVSVIDIGVTGDGKKMMVLEFAPGDSLSAHVERPMARARVIDLVRQLLRGLDHAHGLGLVHRDLKPDNVLVEQTADGREIPRIVDFGIAVLRDAGDDSGDGRRLTTSGVVLGTPMYMAPEQAKGEAVDPRTDLFALGVIVYEMLAGCTPFEGSGLEVMMLNMLQEPPSIATRTGVDVDPLLEAFARKLMARELSERFASAQQALEVLDWIEGDRDRATRALGLTSNVPVVTRSDSVVTARHAAIDPAALADGLAAIEAAARAAAIRQLEQESDSPSRRRRGVTFGAAALLAAAIVGAFLLGLHVG